MNFLYGNEINIITPSTGWYLEFAFSLLEAINNLGFKVCLLHNHTEVKKKGICFYLSYPNKVPLEFIENSFKSLVIHASRLPAGKGFSPWVWQILEGKKVIPITLFEMVEELDAGPIVNVDYMKLSGDELVSEIRKKLAQKIEQMCLSYLQTDKIPISETQKGEETFYRRRNQEDSRLDISKSVLEQFNLLRVVDNEQYPAFFDHLGYRYILKIEKTIEKH